MTTICPPSRTDFSRKVVQAFSPSSAIQAPRLPSAGARKAPGSSKKGGLLTARSNSGRSSARNPAATSPSTICASASFSAAFSRASAAMAGSRSSPVRATPGQRAEICISTAPAPQPASITRSPGVAATAAASRAASIPAR